jgi:capsular polysaccharide biosynthesis protein
VELRRYLEVSRRWWWAVALAFLVTTAVTVSSVAFEGSTYESSATFVVRPRPIDGSQDARAFDALIRGVTINTTYATIARSRLIRDRAEAQLDPAAREDDMSVSAKVLTDTNVMSLSVTGPDADHVLALANAVGAETVEYVNGLSEVYVLQPLDEPTRPGSPVANNKMLTISIGIVLGLALGVGLAMLVEYLHKAPAEPAASETSTARTKPQEPRKRTAKTPAKTPAKAPAKTAAKAPAKTRARTPAETPASGDREAEGEASRATRPPPTEPAASETSTARPEDATSPKDTTGRTEPQVLPKTPAKTPASGDGVEGSGPSSAADPAAPAARRNGEPDRPG